MTYMVLDNGVERPATPDEAAEIASRAANVAPSVPQEVTKRQGLLALFDVGITEAMIEAKIAELVPADDLERALIDYRAAVTFERQNPLVIMLGAAFALDLDLLFTTAKAIP